MSDMHTRINNTKRRSCVHRVTAVVAFSKIDWPSVIPPAQYRPVTTLLRHVVNQNEVPRCLTLCTAASLSVDGQHDALLSNMEHRLL